MWKITIFTIFLLITPLHSANLLPIEISISKLQPSLDATDFSLVFFISEPEQTKNLEERGYQEAFRLLGKKADDLTVYTTKISSTDKKTLESYDIAEKPAVRLFWKGIMLQPPNLLPENAISIYRWINRNLRASKIEKYEVIDAEDFFEDKKEAFPYIILGIGNLKSSEAERLRIFSQMPENPFSVLLTEDELAKEVFQTIKLKKAGYNILLINNISKKIFQFEGDIDIRDLWKFAVKGARLAGIGQLSTQQSYLKSALKLNKQVMIILNNNEEEITSDQRTLDSFRQVANDHDWVIFWGVFNRSVEEQIGYRTCPEGVTCGYLFTNFFNKEKRQTNRYVLNNFSADAVESSLILHKQIGYRQPYYQSSKDIPKILENSNYIFSLNRENYENEIGRGNKDSLALVFHHCGANCEEKIKILEEVIQAIDADSKNNLKFYFVDLRKNEMPESIYHKTSLGFMYSRKTQPFKWIEVNYKGSELELLNEIKNLATFELSSEMDEDEDLEDLL